KKLAHLNKKGSPVYAILLQFVIALILVHTSGFQQVMTYIGFTLSLFTTLTVGGVFINRFKNPSHPSQYRTVGYPLTPILFIVIEVFMMVYIFIKNPWPSIAGFLTILSGLFVYVLINKNKK
ncbi:MAG TPA: amino acid permease, partial [Cytophagaceae bacterium]|nr:amino acid permease [Cytophagaceae bacterium]